MPQPGVSQFAAHHHTPRLAHEANAERPHPSALRVIEAINRDGVAAHLEHLLALRGDLIGYLKYLSLLGNGRQL